MKLKANPISYLQSPPSFTLSIQMKSNPVNVKPKLQQLERGAYKTHRDIMNNKNPRHVNGDGESLMVIPKMEALLREVEESEQGFGTTPAAVRVLEERLWPSTAPRTKDPVVIASSLCGARSPSSVYGPNSILYYSGNHRILSKIRNMDGTNRVSPNDYVDLGPDPNVIVTVYDREASVSPSPTYSERPLLLLDIMGVLVDREYKPLGKGVVETPEHREGGIRIGSYLAWKRPYLDAFLDYCFEHFEVALWTTMTLKSAEALTKFVFGERIDKIRGILNREHCEIVYPVSENEHISTKPTLNEETIGKNLGEGKPVFRKNLSIIWETNSEFDEDNTIVVDDNDKRMVNNPKHCHLNPGTWKRTNVKDEVLGRRGMARVYLEEIVNAKDKNGGL